MNRIALAFLPLLLLAAIVAFARHDETPVHTLACYVTSLDGRTPNQRHNVEVAFRHLNGVVIAPGSLLSFNRIVGAWSSDTAFKRAPVSYDGELVPGWGGGVCQASSTLYNAGLLAGLDVIERRRHQWLPSYAPPGQDAAVAYPFIDLKMRNPHAMPVTVHASVAGNLARVELQASQPLAARYEVTSEISGLRHPASFDRLWQPGDETSRIRNAGKIGCRATTHRLVFERGTLVRRERLFSDSYPDMPCIVQRGG